MDLQAEGHALADQSGHLHAFMPHGMCYLWDPAILWTHVVSDALIGLSYFSIPAALAIFASRRPDLAYRPIIWIFTAFIVLCGLTHLFSIHTVWTPDYPAEGVLKAATALVSVATAVTLWPLLPRALALPSNAQLEARNAALTEEVSKRAAAERRLADLATSLERRVADRTSELERANRALQDFAATASHDLQSPVRQIGLLAQLIRRDAGPTLGEEAAERLELIGRSVDRMQGLIAGLLDYAKLIDTPPNPAPLDLNALMADMAADHSGELTAIGAELDIGPLPGVEADAVLIRQVFENLLSNAVKYRGDAPLRVKIEGAEVNGFAEIAFTDNGPGVPAEYAETIFKMLQRLTATPDGAGVGLAFCRQIIESHGGRIILDTHFSGGARFLIRLPRAGVQETPA